MGTDWNLCPTAQAHDQAQKDAHTQEVGWASWAALRGEWVITGYPVIVPQVTPLGSISAGGEKRGFK